MYERGDVFTAELPAKELGYMSLRTRCGSASMPPPSRRRSTRPRGAIHQRAHGGAPAHVAPDAAAPGGGFVELRADRRDEAKRMLMRLLRLRSVGWPFASFRRAPQDAGRGPTPWVLHAGGKSPAASPSLSRAAGDLLRAAATPPESDPRVAALTRRCTPPSPSGALATGPAAPVPAV